MATNMNVAAMVRLLMFAGGGTKELFRFGLTTRSDAARVREAMLHLGIPWLAARLAEERPVAIVRTRPTISRLDAMRDEFSSVIVCLRHPAARADLRVAADLLLDRGHAWLGEPLALWLVGEREKAVDLLLDHVPVLDDYAEWDFKDTFGPYWTSSRLEVDPDTGYLRVASATRTMGNPERDDFYSRITRASEP